MPSRTVVIAYPSHSPYGLSGGAISEDRHGEHAAMEACSAPGGLM